LPIPHVGPDLILLAFVPALVFEAAIGLNLYELWRMLLPVTLLATVGVVLTVLGVGVVVHLALGLSWAAAFLLGAIVAATDPIAIRERPVGSRPTWPWRMALPMFLS
jgi:NhaP-type Na+/H+ or K+/H+ antiporter